MANRSHVIFLFQLELRSAANKIVLIFNYKLRVRSAFRVEVGDRVSGPLRRFEFELEDALRSNSKARCPALVFFSFAECFYRLVFVEN